MSEINTKNTTKEKEGLPNYTRAQFDLNSFNAENNSCDIVAATETPVLMRDSDGELFYEILGCSDENIVKDRIATSLPLLDNHDKKGSVTKVILGRTDGYRIENRQLICPTIFSGRDELRGFVKDVADGIIQNTSIGYNVLKYIDITKDGDKIRTLKAILWQPIELSMTTVQADAQSKIRLAALDFDAPEIVPDKDEKIILLNNNRTLNMEDEAIVIPVAEPEVKPVVPAAKTRAEDIARAGSAAVDEYKKRSATIRTIAEKAKVIDEEFIISLVDGDMTLERAQQDIIDKWGSAQNSAESNVIVGANGNPIRGGEDRERKGLILSIDEAISIRSFGVGAIHKDGPQTEWGKRLAEGGRRITLMDMAVRSLEMAGVSGVNQLREGEIFERAMATGDFPLTLANVMNKNLRHRYQQAEPVWMKFAKKVSAQDFKKIYGVQVDGNVIPGKLTEKGEYPNVKFKEAGDSFALDTYGLTFELTRKLFINDDLNAFSDFAPLVSDGFMYNNTELVYTALFGANGLGRTIGEDGKTVFHAAHGNIAGAGSVMSQASFKAANTAMRQQTTLAGRKMNVNKGKYLLVPNSLEIDADVLIHSTITPTNSSQVNSFKGAFEVLVEDFLTNQTQWTLIADPSKIESVKYATLDGQEGISTTQTWDAKRDAWSLTARTDFSATCEEYRGVYTNPGA